LRRVGEVPLHFRQRLAALEIHHRLLDGDLLTVHLQVELDQRAGRLAVLPEGRLAGLEAEADEGLVNLAWLGVVGDYSFVRLLPARRREGGDYLEGVNLLEVGQLPRGDPGGDGDGALVLVHGKTGGRLLVAALGRRDEEKDGHGGRDQTEQARVHGVGLRKVVE